jgi:hypothetical protein
MFYYFIIIIYWPGHCRIECVSGSSLFRKARWASLFTGLRHGTISWELRSADVMARRRRQHGAEPQGEGVPRRWQQVLLVDARRPAVVAAQPHVPVIKMHLQNKHEPSHHSLTRPLRSSSKKTSLPTSMSSPFCRPVQLRGAVVAGAHLHRRGAAVARRGRCHRPQRGNTGEKRCKRSDCYSSEGIIAGCFGLGRNSPTAAAGSRGAARDEKRPETRDPIQARGPR